MAPQLSEELQQELARQGDEPFQVVDPKTQRVYVLISADIFERLKPLLGDDFDILDTYAAQSTVAGAAGWDDPEMDIYNDYGTTGGIVGRLGNLM